MSVRWNDKSALEWLIVLKEELERLGLDKNPSRVELQKVYDPDILPAPTTYMGQIGKSWKDIVGMLGLDYDQGAAKKTGRPKKNVTDEEKKEVLIALAKHMRTTGITRADRFNESRGELPTLQWFAMNIAPWKKTKEIANRLLEEEENK